MPEIKHRQINPSPEIEYAEICIPDDRDWGTGSFKTVTKPGAFSSGKSISSIKFNPPAFQISLNLNPGNRKVPVLLGRADGSYPISRKVYILPEKIEVLKIHEFEVTFKVWRITRLYMDKVSLKEEGILPRNMPIPEHEGTLGFTIPRYDFTQEIKEGILDDIFDLSRDFIFCDIEHGNTRLKIYRDTRFQFVYDHYNPTFGKRELKVDFGDAKREGAKGFFICATWSAAKNSFHIGLYHSDPKFVGLRKTFVLTKDKLRLVRETLREFERLLNESKREEDVQQFLGSNSILIGLTSTIEPIPKFKLGDDYVVDFIIREIPNGYVLVEIERPAMRLFKKSTPPERTQELNHAIQQIENWKAWISRNHSYISSKLEGISPTPLCWLIAGRRIRLSKEESKRLAEINEIYKEAYKIFTYEDVVDRVKAVIDSLLG